MTHHPPTRVGPRAAMRCDRALPWPAHCHACCLRLLESDVLGVQDTWWFATQEDALAFALAHLGQHCEVTS